MPINKKNQNVLILYNSVPYFLKYLNQDNVRAYKTLKEISLPLKVVRKISRSFNLMRDYWYEEWKNYVKSSEIVIVFAPLQDLGVIKYIRAVNPSIRIIYWFWNPVYRIGLTQEKFTEDAEFWSFDINDSKRFDMGFNTTFYFEEITLPQMEIEYDVVFVGVDKGRGDELRSIQESFKDLGLCVFFYIVPDKNDKTSKEIKNISYDKYLEIVGKAKAIFDMKPEGQTGLTLRPMEAIFFERKLITTDGNIIDQDFYDDANIFVLGKDDLNGLKNFIESKYKPIDPTIVKKYAFQEWIKRFNE